MGFYEPVIVLGLLIGVYAVTQLLSQSTKRKFIWWSVALILAIGVVGVTRDLTRHGTLVNFPSSE